MTIWNATRSRMTRAAVAMALPLAYDLLLRPRLLTWGATNEEVAGTYPGDEFIADPNGGATMAITLPAPPAAVWLWLVRMGGGGGWYSWDHIDNKGQPSDQGISHDLRHKIGSHG